MLEIIMSLLTTIFLPDTAYLIMAIWIESRFHTLFMEAGSYADEFVAFIDDLGTDIEPITHFLRGDPGNEVICSFSPPDEFAEKICEQGDDIICFRVDTQSPKSMCNFGTAYDLVRSHRLRGLCLANFREAIPSSYLESSVPIPLLYSGEDLAKAEDKFDEFNKFLISFGCEHHDEIINCLRTAKWAMMGTYDNRFNWLRMTASLVELMSRYTEESPGVHEEYQRSLDYAISEIDNHQDNSGLDEAWLRRFRSYLRDRGTVPQDINEAICETASGLFLDEDSYYLDERVFREVCEPLLATAGIHQINQALADAEIQTVTNYSSRNHYTVKKTLYFAGGHSGRYRFHQLNRKKIDLPTTASARKTAKQSSRSAA